jgi:hypothetical protein
VKQRATPALRLSLCCLLLFSALPLAGAEPPSSPLDVADKLRFHGESLYGPWAVAESVAYAGVLQAWNRPEEWGQGGGAYGKRLASTGGGSAIRAALGFGLDSALREDPRYFRAGGGGFWRRAAHALRGTVLTRTDRGSETLSVWRVGSAYGAAFLSNQWQPDRLNTVGLGAAQGSLRIGVDFASNLGAEFWPDVKRRLFRRR